MNIYIYIYGFSLTNKSQEYFLKTLRSPLSAEYDWNVFFIVVWILKQGFLTILMQIKPFKKQWLASYASMSAGVLLFRSQCSISSPFKNN